MIERAEPSPDRMIERAEPSPDRRGDTMMVNQEIARILGSGWSRPRKLAELATLRRRAEREGDSASLAMLQDAYNRVRGMIRASANAE